jgi:hypothetical protein
MRPIPSSKGLASAANTDNVLGSMRELGTLPVFDYYTATVQRAASPAEVVEAVATYLSYWPRGRVLKLQAMVGGWAPFDERQQPLPIESREQVRALGDDLERQRRNFEASGAAITLELFEIEMCFLMARRRFGKR